MDLNDCLNVGFKILYVPKLPENKRTFYSITTVVEYIKITFVLVSNDTK